jgi:hypothetical protein
MIDCQAIRKRWEAVGSKLDERGRRVFATGEVRAAGWGGLEAVSEITGLARSTIGRGLKDLDAGPLPKGRVRRKGGGPRALCLTQNRFICSGGYPWFMSEVLSVPLRHTDNQGRNAYRAVRRSDLTPFHNSLSADRIQARSGVVRNVLARRSRRTAMARSPAARR